MESRINFFSFETDGLLIHYSPPRQKLEGNTNGGVQISVNAQWLKLIALRTGMIQWENFFKRFM